MPISEVIDPAKSSAHEVALQAVVEFAQLSEQERRDRMGEFTVERLIELRKAVGSWAPGIDGPETSA